MAAIVIDDDSHTPSVKQALRARADQRPKAMEVIKGDASQNFAEDADLLGFMATAEKLIKSSNAQGSLAGMDLSAFVTMTQGLIKSMSARVKTRESEEPKESAKPEASVKAEESIMAKTTMKAEDPMKAEEPLKAAGVARGGAAKLISLHNSVLAVDRF